MAWLSLEPDGDLVRWTPGELMLSSRMSPAVPLLGNVNLPLTDVGILVPPETGLSRPHDGCPSALLLNFVHDEVGCHESGYGLLVLS